MNFETLLQLMLEKKASDLFITAGIAPSMKVAGRVEAMMPRPLSPEKARELTLSIMNEDQQQEFARHKECNFAIQLQGVGRFRVNAFIQKGNVGMVLRRIETYIPSFEELHLPRSTFEALAEIKRGLVLFVGATGSGKSTSLAALIDHRNRHADGHIITLEDPIEYLHEHRRCIVTQREVGIDTDSYEIGLRNTLRQAPDVILLGEVRSAETMGYSIQFAETGHLCLTTLHANNANQAIERILHLIPKEKHHQTLMDLSQNLRAVIAQQLVPTVDGKKRVVIEILLISPFIADLIRKGELHEIKDVMKRSTEEGMCTFDQSLFRLYCEGAITEEVALKHADSMNDVRLMIKLHSKGDLSEELLSKTENLTFDADERNNHQGSYFLR